MENAVKRTNNRVDSWTPEQDRELAEIILHCIREGRTQTEAFAEAANVLGRTPGACGVRWNVVVRKQYEDQLQEAKQAKRNNWGGRQTQHVWRRRAAARTLDAALRSLRAQEQACLRLERRIAELGVAVSETVTKIREQIAILEEGRRRYEERGASEDGQAHVSPEPLKG